MCYNSSSDVKIAFSVRCPVSARLREICLPRTHQDVHSRLLKKAFYLNTYMPLFSLLSIFSIPPFDLLNHNVQSLCLHQSACLPIHLSLLLICTPPLLRLISKCHRREPSAAEISVHNVTMLPRGVLYINPSVCL